MLEHDMIMGECDKMVLIEKGDAYFSIYGVIYRRIVKDVSHCHCFEYGHLVEGNNNCLFSESVFVVVRHRSHSCSCRHCKPVIRRRTN